MSRRVWHTLLARSASQARAKKLLPPLARVSCRRFGVGQGTAVCGFCSCEQYVIMAHPLKHKHPAQTSARLPSPQQGHLVVVVPFVNGPPANASHVLDNHTGMPHKCRASVLQCLTLAGQLCFHPTQVQDTYAICHTCARNGGRQLLCWVPIVEGQASGNETTCAFLRAEHTLLTHQTHFQVSPHVTTTCLTFCVSHTHIMRFIHSSNGGRVPWGFLSTLIWPQTTLKQESLQQGMHTVKQRQQHRGAGV